MPPKKSNKLAQAPPAHVSFDLDTIVSALPQPTQILGAGKSSRPNKSQGTSAPDDMASYTEINKSSWLSIPVDTYIRYIDQSGNWRPGARVKSVKQDPSGGNSFVIGKFNPFIKKFTKWSVPFSNIATLYKLKDDVKQVSDSKPIKLITTTPQNISPEVAAQITNPAESNEEQILGQLGNKLLFEDGEMIRHKVDGLEADVQRMSEDIRKLGIIMKRLYKRLDAAGVP